MQHQYPRGMRGCEHVHTREITLALGSLDLTLRVVVCTECGHSWHTVGDYQAPSRRTVARDLGVAP